MNKERLLNVAKALREAPNPKSFDMSIYVHGCGTPACALGHYGCRSDLQDVFYQRHGALLSINEEGGESMLIMATAQKHFDITAQECDELFESRGCGGARTPKQAAEYIERFVKVRTWPVAMGAVCL